MAFLFFTRQEFDDAGRIGTRLQKILLVLLALFILENALSIFAMLRFSQPTTMIAEDPSLASRNPSVELSGEAISLVVFSIIWTIGFWGSYHRNPTALLVYVILNIVWLVFSLILLALVVLLILLLFGLVLVAAKQQQQPGQPGGMVPLPPIETADGMSTMVPSKLSVHAVARLSHHLMKRFDTGDDDSSGFSSDPYTSPMIDSAQAWEAVVLGFMSLGISVVSFVLWVITIWLAFKQRKLITDPPMSGLILPGDGHPQIIVGQFPGAYPVAISGDPNAHMAQYPVIVGQYPSVYQTNVQ